MFSKMQNLFIAVLILIFMPLVAGAETWTDPTCAPPNCNTDGPVWSSPGSSQDAYADLDYSTEDNNPIFAITDARTTGATNGSLYIVSSVDSKPALKVSNIGTTASSYAAEFSASVAPGLKLTGGIDFVGRGTDPTYTPTGLLYYNTVSNLFKFYNGTTWVDLGIQWSVDGDELYHSLSAGTAKGVGIKTGDTTSPNDAYTLDIYRKSQSTSDRALYARLERIANTNYVSGTLGGYVTIDASDYLAGVIGKAEGPTLGLGVYGKGEYAGGYFENEIRGGYGIMVKKHDSGGFSSINPAIYASNDHPGGYGITVYANSTSGTVHGGYFNTAGGSNSAGVYGRATDTGVGATYGGYFANEAQLGAGVYGYSSNIGVQGYVYKSTGGGIGVEGNADYEGAVTNYGGHFTASGDTGRGIYAIADETGAFSNYGGYFIANGDTGIGVKSHASATGAVVNYGGWFSASGDSARGIYSTVSGSSARAVEGYSSATGAVINYGGYFEALGNSGRGVFGNASTTGAIANYGGYFISAGDSGRAVYAIASASGAVGNYGGYFEANGDSGTGVYAAAFGSGGTAIYGDGMQYGLYGSASGNTGYAVYGEATQGGAYTNYGGYFLASGDSGVGVYARGPNTPTTTALALKLDNGGMAMEELGTLPANTANYGKFYVKSSDSMPYFLDDGGVEHGLIGGTGTIADGTAEGQLTYWDNTGGTWAYTDTSELVWDNTNTRLGIGDASPDYSLDIVKDQNATTSLAISNPNTGTSARAGFSLWNGTGAGDGAYFNLTSDNYTGVSGWDDTFILQTGSLVSNGMRIYTGVGPFIVSNSGTTAPDLYVDNNGVVGVGTSSVSSYDRLTAEHAGVVDNVTAVYARATGTGVGLKNYAGRFLADGDDAIAIYAAGPTVPTTTALALKLDNAAMAMEELGTLPINVANYGNIYVKSSDSLLYFQDDGGTEYGLTGGGSSDSIWDADTNTGVQVEESANENYIRFDISGTERMKIDSTGDVAIGMYADPIVGRFQVAGGFAVIGNSTTNRSIANGDGDLYVEEDLEVDLRAYIGEDLYIGAGNTSDDDYLYFDNSEFIMWDDSEGEFDFSDDLNITGGITTSYFIDGPSFRDSSNTAYFIDPAGGNSGRLLGDLSIGYADSATADDYLYFNWANDYLMWDDSESGFILSDELGVLEGSAPTATSGRGKFYVKSIDSLAYFMDDAGVEYGLTGGGSVDEVWDADADTGMQVEEGVDDDTFRIDTAGSERMTISSTGMVNITNSTVDVVSSYTGSAFRLFEVTASGAGTGTQYAGYFSTAAEYAASVYGITSGDSATGVSGISSATGAVTNVGGSFLAYGDTGIGVQATATSTNSGLKYGGKFLVNGSNGVGVRGAAAGSGGIAVEGDATGIGAVTNYGGYFEAAGDSGVGVYAAGPATPTTTALALKLDNGAMAMEELATLPINTTNYGKFYVKSSDSLPYFKDDGGTEYSLVGGGDSNWDADSDTGIQVEEGVDDDTFRIDTAGVERLTIDASGDLLFGADYNFCIGIEDCSNIPGSDPTISGIYKNSSSNLSLSGEYITMPAAHVAIGSTSTTYQFNVVEPSTNGRAVYATATGTGAQTNYGGWFESAGDTGIAVYGSATSINAGVNYGGSFVAAGDSGRGVQGTATETGAVTNYGGVFRADGDNGTGVYAYANNGSGTGLYASGNMEAARFNGSEVVIATGAPGTQNYATASGDLYVEDDIEADGAIYTTIYYDSANTTYYLDPSSSTSARLEGNIQIGYGSAADDDYIYFNQNADQMHWDEAQDRFEFSDTIYSDANLGAAQEIYVGYGSSTDDDFLYFDISAEWLKWDEAATRFEFTDTVYASGGYLSSDGRFKSERSDISGALSIVEKLEPINYVWDFSKNPDLENGREGEHDIGFIAQDVYEILPELVYKPIDESEDIWSMDYSKMTAVLAGAIQEQQVQIEELQEKTGISSDSNNDEVMDYIKSLESRIEDLEIKLDQKEEVVEGEIVEDKGFWTNLWD